MDQRSIRLDSFNNARDAVIKLYEHRNPHLDDADLKAFRIKLSKMDLQTGAPTGSGPQFCEPYPAKEFEMRFKNEGCKAGWPRYRDRYSYCAALELWLTLKEYLGSDILESSLSFSSPWYERYKDDDNPFESELYCVDRPNEDWQTHDILESKNDSTPHFGCILLGNAEPDARLLRSEVYCALRLMAGRVRSWEYKAHKIVPVFVYSFCGRRVRVIQAHYESPNFIIRKTEYIDLEKEDIGNIKLLLRWMMSSPKGETRFKDEPLLPLPKKVPSSKKSSKDRWIPGPGEASQKIRMLSSSDPPLVPAYGEASPKIRFFSNSGKASSER